ncbi:hypothetical protein AKJ16_DCAP16028 [Drosera capensis]
MAGTLAAANMEGEEDDLLDFEFLTTNNNAPANKRRKIIGLDDLLSDLKEEHKTKQKSKVVKPRKQYKLDDDDDDKTEISLFKAIKKIDGQNGILDEHDSAIGTASWGSLVFGAQRNPSPVAHSDLGCSKMLGTFLNNELNSLVDLSMETGEAFVKGLLSNGWLSKLVLKCGHLEESIAKWAFNQLLYSSEESSRTFACEFWCSILLYNEVDAASIKIDWLPSYSLLNDALESFGYLLLPQYVAPNEELTGSSECQGPPSNIISWIKFSSICCQVRSRHQMFSVSETEELIRVMARLSLDQRLLGLSSIMNESLISAINYFTDEEWDNSCQSVAKSLAERVPRDLNCLRTVECIPSVDSRGKQLKSATAFEVLKLCFQEKIDNAQDALTLLISTAVKDTSCDLFHTYICLVLVNNWLTFETLSNDPGTDQLWGTFLRKCSSQISSNDVRPYAQEVRNRASYLLKGTGNDW